MATIAVNNLRNFQLLILVSQRQVYTSFVAGDGLQILD
jgi:hypothetical protein